MVAKYRYDKLKVAALAPVYFDPADPKALNKAVAHLKSIPDAKFVGLIAETSVTAGKYKLRAQVFFKLGQIVGKTPAQVWDMFDRQVDTDRENLANGIVG